jgi:hypothetical protein
MQSLPSEAEDLVDELPTDQEPALFPEIVRTKTFNLAPMTLEEALVQVQYTDGWSRSPCRCLVQPLMGSQLQLVFASRAGIRQQSEHDQHCWMTMLHLTSKEGCMGDAEQWQCACGMTLVEAALQASAAARAVVLPCI